MLSRSKLKQRLSLAICSWAFHNGKISEINYIFLLNRFSCSKNKMESLFVPYIFFLFYIKMYLFLVKFHYTVLPGCRMKKCEHEMVQKALLRFKISLLYQEKSTGGAAGARG